MSLPALKAFKEQNGGHLTYAVDLNVSPVLCYQNWIDNVVDYRTVDQSKYDQVYDLTSCAMEYEFPGRPVRNRIDIYGDCLGVTLKDTLPPYQVSKPEQVRAKFRYLESKDIVVHVDALDPVRDWKRENWAHLFHLMKSLRYRIIVSDQTQRWIGPNIIQPELTFRELGALIQQANLFVGPDSGPMHLAGAVKTRSLVLFGAVPPGARLNHYPTHTALVSSSACQGWHRQHCGSKCCMDDLTPEYVFQQIVLALNEQSLL